MEVKKIGEDIISEYLCQDGFNFWGGEGIGLKLCIIKKCQHRM
jgi:hypothetical protein